VEPGKREGEWWRWNGQEVFFFKRKEGAAFCREDGNEGRVLKVEDERKGGVAALSLAKGK